MLEVISTLTEGNHFFFAKNYEPPRKGSEDFMQMLDKSDNFFTGLPKSKSKNKRFTVTTHLMSKEQSARLKLKKLEYMMQKLAAATEQVKTEMNQMK